MSQLHCAYISGTERWVPPIRVTLQIQQFFTSMIMGERVPRKLLLTCFFPSVCEVMKWIFAPWQSWDLRVMILKSLVTCVKRNPKTRSMMGLHMAYWMIIERVGSCCWLVQLKCGCFRDFGHHGQQICTMIMMMKMMMMMMMTMIVMVVPGGAMKSSCCILFLNSTTYWGFLTACLSAGKSLTWWCKLIPFIYIISLCLGLGFHWSSNPLISLSENRE